MRKMVQRIGNRICRARVERALPGIVAEVADYAKGSGTTGTQWITLWKTVRGILRHRPEHVLESGTGSSTLVLAAAIQRLMREDPGYKGRLISMESVAEWYVLAQSRLPAKYRDVVEIVLGPREKFDVAMFRGYIHSNIPQHDYSFVLLDGPAFSDEHGITFCADLFRIMDLSSAPVIHGVVDGRPSTVYVLQALFGTGAARYWHGLFAAHFSVPRIDFRNAEGRSMKNFGTSVLGRLQFIKFR